ncbi:MAG: NUDIX domain-containing protein [Pirellulaceae bacterium]|jgi:predicted NUDIX family NTP pyrophosphohydrolase|nr:NUDIX domain-containing protein [Pirellulaceae bacterium]MCU0978856.1 NUDIX domain-containing protein [Pirellulaceae bacterium]
MVHSAGTLLYRYRDGRLEVLLIHPSGAYHRRTPWGIPKGVPNEGEDLEQTARRETMEETGVVAGELTPLDFIQYHKVSKRVHCFAGPAPADAAPNCECWEVDRVEFVPLDEARRLIHPDQLPFLERLDALLAKS